MIKEKEPFLEEKEKIKIPQDVQQNMMNFFMRTSIPRKKFLAENAENENHLLTQKEGR